MYTRKILGILGSILILSALIPASSHDQSKIMVVDPNLDWGVLAGPARDACSLIKAMGAPASWLASFSLGQSTVTYYDPDACNTVANYPFDINSVTFMLYGITGTQWPVAIDVVVYDLTESGDPCDGPGTELYRQTVICDESTFEGPNYGTVPIDDSLCLTRPFFAGIELSDQGTGPFPTPVFDDSNVDTCDNWYRFDGLWREWSDYFEPEPGYPVLMVTGETCSGNCSCYADTDVNNDGLVLSVADMMHLMRYLSGDEEAEIPIPYKADLNADCMIDYLDFEVYSDYFENGLAAFNPYGGFPPLTCCNPELTLGACCIESTCKPLNPVNCDLFAGEYNGDGIWCDSSLCDTCYDQFPGDANGDAQVNIGDATYLISYLLKGGPAPYPTANGDPNGDCCTDLVDIAYLICMIPPHVGVTPVDCTCLDVPICTENIRVPGDANGDSTLNVGDVVYIIAYGFKYGAPPTPFSCMSGDANNDGTVNVGDAVFMISYIFTGGPAPVTAGEWMASRPCFHPDGYWMNR